MNRYQEWREEVYQLGNCVYQVDMDELSHGDLLRAWGDGLFPDEVVENWVGERAEIDTDY